MAGPLRNEASAYVAEFFLRSTGLPFSVIHLPGAGGAHSGEFIHKYGDKTANISAKDITHLLKNVATILISAPTYYEPTAHKELAFWEEILPPVEEGLCADKYGIAISIGGLYPQEALKAIVNFFSRHKVKLYAAIANNGVEDCFKCNVGKVCYISDALENFDPASSVMQDIIATAHFEREEIPDCCPGKVQLMPTIEDLARRFGEIFLSRANTP